uniref:Uncharacterized protein n=1 Tax=Spermophilus dauricus TaxID=99837 RepID=A0A8C9QLF0_SPEDA
SSHWSGREGGQPGGCPQPCILGSAGRCILGSASWEVLGGASWEVLGGASWEVLGGASLLHSDEVLRWNPSSDLSLVGR